MARYKIEYNSSKKVFYVKINSGQHYEKSTVEELTKELARLGVKWKLSKNAKKQIEAFKLRK